MGQQQRLPLLLAEGIQTILPGLVDKPLQQAGQLRVFQCKEVLQTIPRPAALQAFRRFGQRQWVHIGVRHAAVPADEPFRRAARGHQAHAADP